MTWMVTYTGKKFSFTAPRAEDVDIEDIAHSLSMLARFNGHTLSFYSVAEHSVLMANQLLKARSSIDCFLAYVALLHDSVEAYTGDIIRPLKYHFDGVGDGFNRIENDVWAAITTALDLPFIMPRSVIEADRKMLKTEGAALNPRWDISEWEGLDEVDAYDDVVFKFWQPHDAKREFLSLYHKLKKHAQGGGK